MEPVRVALVNDYEIVLQGLMAMLRSYRDVIEVVELDVRRDVADPVDIALFDTFASSPSDSEEIRTLVDNAQVTHVVVYSWVLDPDVVDAALKDGVSAYLSKELPAARLVEALVDIHQGKKVPKPAAKKEPIAVVGGDWPGREEGITQRESEVLALIVQGLSNAEIASRTHLSINSVKTYIRSCYRRIGAENRTQAALWAVEHGFKTRPKRSRSPDTEALLTSE